MAFEIPLHSSPAYANNKLSSELINSLSTKTFAVTVLLNSYWYGFTVIPVAFAKIDVCEDVPV